jgi:hypothetical protein
LRQRKDNRELMRETFEERLGRLPCRVHLVVLELSLITIFGAVAGSQGWSEF